jgi:hypothetical protein
LRNPIAVAGYLREPCRWNRPPRGNSAAGKLQGVPLTPRGRLAAQAFRALTPRDACAHPSTAKPIGRSGLAPIWRAQACHANHRKCHAPVPRASRQTDPRDTKWRHTSPRKFDGRLNRRPLMGSRASYVPLEVHEPRIRYTTAAIRATSPLRRAASSSACSWRYSRAA